ncbi:zinc finger protein 28-like isoform X2 [Macrosteles quadrilineatus]|uniref:zinc finger protein 28-like isoform X2 n=1 Tax=Macrosteles quadrilineatus TaxID=74068 RepID=UPI0023E33ADD|nr:zinc finger protein 28-like isoform X2 [Macrosteles quadrilineatus]
MEEEECLPQEESAWADELDVDISQLCRICANPNEYLIPIFHGEGKEHELEEKISKHLPIKVAESDTLPTNLCYQCASTLIAWHDMVVGCIEADDKLKSVSGKDTKTTDEITKNDTEVEQDSNSQQASVPEMQINNAAYILQEQEPELTSSVNEENVIEEIIPADKFDVIEDKTADSSNFVIVQTNTKDEIVETIETNEESIMDEVEVYEHPDIETSIIVSEFAEGLEEGQYIAYIDGELIQSSVEVVNPEFEDAAEMEDTKGFICEECNQIFMDIVAFQTHLSLHQTKGHLCNYCDATYRRIDHLQKHMEIMHPEANVDLLPKVKKPNPYAKTFLCNTCGKILRSSIAYENHTLKHQSKCPYPCDLCSETFPNRGARRRHEVKEHNLLTKENGNPDGYHVCEVCGLEMFSDGAYYHHKDKHGDPYPCTFCGKLFGSRSLMQVHARRHTTERPFVCSLCNRNFKVKQELNAHMNIHKDLRPYQCPHCPKMCRKSSDLTHHIRTHTGEKPFICERCGRGFAQAGDMRKHRQLHFRPSKINKNLPV